MDPASDNQNSDSSILAVLVQTDPSPWCFLPLPGRGQVAWSKTFATLWNLPHQWSGGTPTGGLPPQHHIARALEQQGINPDTFFPLVSGCGYVPHTSVLLVRSDQQKVQAEITPVVLVNQILGHLVRFRTSLESTVVDSLMLEVSDAQRRLAVLSQREREVLQFVYQGRTNKAISICAGISEKTVEKHRARIMQKLEVACTAQLFRLVSKAWLFSDMLVPDTRSGVLPEGSVEIENSASLNQPGCEA